MPKKSPLSGSSVLITGGTGSWGNELTRQLFLHYHPREIRIYSRGEHKQVEMKRKFKDERVKYYIGDVRDRERLTEVMHGVNYVFHLAALKHVPVCEENPSEAVKTNIIGVENIIDASIITGVKKVIDVSTDKAVDPFNLYGVTKAVGEKLIIAANNLSDTTRFVCIRGGNVLGTNGSVIPLFYEQILRLNEITITDDRMTRFLMRVEEAIRLVLDATIASVGGEIFVMKMPACRITDLAAVMIKRLGRTDTAIKHIGVRPGEKLFEVLVSKYESPRTHDIGMYYVILPQISIAAIEKHYHSTKKKLPMMREEEFSSNNTHILSLKEIETLLKRDGWVGKKAKGNALEYLCALDKETLKYYFKSEGWLPVK